MPVAFGTFVAALRQPGTFPFRPGILSSHGETIPMLWRLNSGMKRARAMLVAILGIALSMGVLACPIWMSWASEDMPCTKHSSLPERCPISICQISSPYLASNVSAQEILPVEASTEAIHPAILNMSLPVRVIPIQPDDNARLPSNPFFLQTHSFLI